MNGLQITLSVATSLAVTASAFGIRQALSDAEDEADGIPCAARRWHVPTWIATLWLLVALPFFFL